MRMRIMKPSFRIKSINIWVPAMFIKQNRNRTIYPYEINSWQGKNKSGGSRKPKTIKTNII